VMIGIIKSILEDLNEKRNARILLTSGSKINMNLLASAVKDFSCKVGIKLSNGEFEDPKSVKLLNWNSSEDAEIKKISNIIKNIPEQPIDKISKSFIKILTKDKQLWLGVNEKGDLAPSDIPVLFWISNVPFLDQIAYRISNRDFNFIVKFVWATKDECDKFYLVDLNTEQDLYYALEYDDFCIVDINEMEDFEESTPLPHFKKHPTKEGALLFNFLKDSRDDPTNQPIKKRKSGKTLHSFLTELGELCALSGLTIINALNYIIRACNVKKVFKSLSNEFLHLRAKLNSEVEWEITKNNLFNIKKVSDIYQTKSVYDYLLNANIPHNQWKNLTLSYLSLLIMPPFMVIPEFLKIPLPLLSGTSLLEQKINKEISDINFEIGPTGTRLIQTELFLDIFTTKNKFQLDGIQISQLNDIKITIINSDAVNGDPNIIIEACAKINDNTIVKIFTKNENEQFLITRFNNNATIANIAKALNVDEKVYNKFKVPLYDISLDDFLKKINPEFSLLFYPITEPPTMNFKLKNINIFANEFPKMDKFMPPQISQNFSLSNISIDIPIYNPLDIEDIMIGLNINFNLLTTDNKKFPANLSYIPVKNTEQPILISIKPQDLYDSLNLERMLKDIGIYNTFEKIKEASPVLWCVIEVMNVIIDLVYNGAQWSGNIQGVGEIIGKDKKYNCLIEYMSPTKEQFGNLLIKNLTECIALNEIIQIFQLETISTIPVLGKLFEPMNISEININLVNSDQSNFIIQDLSVIIRTDKFEMKPLIIDQVKVYISYLPSKNTKNSVDSAIWNFNIEGNIDTMIATLNYKNETRKIHATLTPVKIKKLDEITKLLIMTPECTDNSLYYEIYDSEVTSIELTININADGINVEAFSAKLLKELLYDEFNLKNLLFKYKEMQIDSYYPNQESPTQKKYILESIISRMKVDRKIEAKIEIDCSENIVDAFITSFQNNSLLDILKLLIGYKSSLENLLPKLPNLPKFDNFESNQKFPIKILIKPFKVIGFNFCAEKEISCKVLEKPLIILYPVGILISYVYDNDEGKEKLEGKLYGTFSLEYNDNTKLRLEFAGSETKDEDIIVASIQVTEGKDSIHVS
ncbi:10722_t:CDS:2, partial [Gigaspora rosea]